MTAARAKPAPPTTSPPAPLGVAGARIWSAVSDEYELEEHESAMLLEMARTVDLLEALDAVVRAAGPMQPSPQGERVHPAAGEARAQRIVLARLAAALRLPAGDEDDPSASRRPQRRSGARGVYGIGGSR